MNKNKTILVVGGTGFIGQELVRYLLQKGFEVKILTRDIEKARSIFHNGVTIHKWPATSEKLMLGATNSCEAVINLAGENIGARYWTKKNKIKILKSRIQSIENLYQIISSMAHKPKVWIQISAVGFYGFDTTEAVDEKSPAGDGFLADVVQQWESAFSKISLESTRKVVLRLGIVISPNGGFLQKLTQSFNWGIAICPGNGKQKLSWIHLDDLTDIIFESIQNNEHKGVINAVAPNVVSMAELTQLVKKNSHACLKFRLPAFIFKFFMGPQKARELILSSQKVIPATLLAKGYKHKYAWFWQVFERMI